MTKTAVNLHALIAAVIGRAVDDLKGIGPRCRKNEADRAMAFILSEHCAGWCVEIGADYETIRTEAAALYRRAIEKEERRRERVTV